ncbi:MAG: sigma-70 family RNA polymerase sigma factor [Deltaproteobacteria bacterium]|nr:sigma-70 family RNA polymerase sigma factor [Deltaproteobacteria bacterium]
MHPNAAPALPPFEELYARHRARALAIARRILRDPAEAEDLVQEVFSRLWNGELPFDGRASCGTWLHRVMVNRSINGLRARRRRARLELSPTLPADPEALAAARERFAQVMATLGHLSSHHRELLTLRELQGLSYPEIALRLGIPEGTVKSALSRARDRLEQLLPP